MSGLSQRAPFLAILLTLALTPASAWQPETRVRMVDEAVRLMPATLRSALETHREPLLRGMLNPMTHEDGPRHRAPWADGRLDSELDGAARRLQDSLRKPLPFPVLADRFGELAHYVVDAGFPPGVSRADGTARYTHFAWFCEDRRERFPVVFYGHDDTELASSDFLGFARRLMQSASENDAQLALSYAAAGDPPDPAYFDDRSVPFAVGSLSYSRSITNIARAWIAVWRQARGDMGRTPYWQTNPSRGG